jgi:hypothetical protein
VTDTTVQGHIVPDESQAVRGFRSARIEGRGEPSVLWFRDLDGRRLGTELADAFVLGSLLHWMAAGGAVHVHGAVSRTLLSNLDEWQAALHSWLPGRYFPVAFTADDVVDVAPAPSAPAISAYSGGLDATCTAIRHARGLVGWRTVDLRVLLLVHGFDIPLDRPAEFDRARTRARESAEELGLELRSVATNFRDLGQSWELAHGLGLASALHLYSPEFGVGLIGSGASYPRIHMPWGSNPTTDPFMSSGTMRIRHDGTELTRTDKARIVATAPLLLRRLRVCWQGEELSRNCGRCEKCVRTYWAFHIAGARQPACFDGPVTVRPSDVRMSVQTAKHWSAMLPLARAGEDEEAVRYISALLRYQRVRGALRRITPLRAMAVRARRRPGLGRLLFS